MEMPPVITARLPASEAPHCWPATRYRIMDGPLSGDWSDALTIVPRLVGAAQLAGPRRTGQITHQTHWSQRTPSDSLDGSNRLTGWTHLRKGSPKAQDPVGQTHQTGSHRSTRTWQTVYAAAPVPGPLAAVCAGDVQYA